MTGPSFLMLWGESPIPFSRMPAPIGGTCCCRTASRSFTRSGGGGGVCSAACLSIGYGCMSRLLRLCGCGSTGPECSSPRRWASIPCCCINRPKGRLGACHAGEQWSCITRLETRTKESIECASVVVSNQSPGCLSAGRSTHNESDAASLWCGVKEGASGFGWTFLQPRPLLISLKGM